MYRVNDELKKRVNEMFGKTEQDVLKEVKNIKKWLETQKHLPEIMGKCLRFVSKLQENFLDDVKIRNMLNLCKFDVKKAKEKIENYYKVRSKYPELFRDSNPNLPCMQKWMEQINIASYPDLLEDLYRILFIRTKASGTLGAKEVFLLYFAILEIRLQADFIVQDVIVIDMSNFTFRDLYRVSLPVMLKIVHAHKDVFSLRMKTVYFVNSPRYVSVFVKLLQYMLPPKVFDRFKVYQTAEKLKDAFPLELLPKDYGGNGKSLDELDEMMKKEFEHYRDRFDLLDSMKVDESLRPKA